VRDFAADAVLRASCNDEADEARCGHNPVGGVGFFWVTSVYWVKDAVSRNQAGRARWEQGHDQEDTKGPSSGTDRLGCSVGGLFYFQSDAENDAVGDRNISPFQG